MSSCCAPRTVCILPVQFGHIPYPRPQKHAFVNSFVQPNAVIVDFSDKSPLESTISDSSKNSQLYGPVASRR